MEKQKNIKGAGRKLMYGEATEQMFFSVPLSKRKEFKEIAGNFLNTLVTHRAKKQRVFKKTRKVKNIYGEVWRKQK